MQFIDTEAPRVATPGPHFEVVTASLTQQMLSVNKASWECLLDPFYEQASRDYLGSVLILSSTL